MIESNKFAIVSRLIGILFDWNFLGSQALEDHGPSPCLSESLSNACKVARWQWLFAGEQVAHDNRLSLSDLDPCTPIGNPQLGSANKTFVLKVFNLRLLS